MHFVFNYEKIDDNDIKNIFEFLKPLPYIFVGLFVDISSIIFNLKGL